MRPRCVPDASALRLAARPAEEDAGSVPGRGRQASPRQGSHLVSPHVPRSQVAQAPGDPSHQSPVRRTERNQRCPRSIGLACLCLRQCRRVRVHAARPSGGQRRGGRDPRSSPGRRSIGGRAPVSMRCRPRPVPSPRSTRCRAATSAACRRSACSPSWPPRPPGTTTSGYGAVEASRATIGHPTTSTIGEAELLAQFRAVELSLSRNLGVDQQVSTCAVES